MPESLLLKPLRIQLFMIIANTKLVVLSCMYTPVIARLLESTVHVIVYVVMYLLDYGHPIVVVVSHYQETSALVHQ